MSEIFQKNEMPTKTTTKTAARKTAPARKPVKAAVRAEAASEPKRKKPQKARRSNAGGKPPNPAAIVAKAKARAAAGRRSRKLRSEKKRARQSDAEFRNGFADRREAAAAETFRSRHRREASVLPPISRFHDAPTPCPCQSLSRRRRTTASPQTSCHGGDLRRVCRREVAEPQKDNSHQAADHRQGSGAATGRKEFPAHQRVDGRYKFSPTRI